VSHTQPLDGHHLPTRMEQQEQKHQRPGAAHGGSAGLKALMALTRDSHRVHALDGQPVIGHTDQDDLGAVLVRIRLLDLGEELYCLGLLYGDATSKPMAGGCGRLLSLAPLVLPCPGM
jgi:hypothetical protein